MADLNKKARTEKSATFTLAPINGDKVTSIIKNMDKLRENTVSGKSAPTDDSSRHSREIGDGKTKASSSSSSAARSASRSHSDGSAQGNLKTKHAGSKDKSGKSSKSNSSSKLKTKTDKNQQKTGKTESETLKEIKEQLNVLTEAMAHVTPIVAELKTAYDHYDQAEDYETPRGNAELINIDDDLSEGELGDPDESGQYGGHSAAPLPADPISPTKTTTTCDDVARTAHTKTTTGSDDVARTANSSSGPNHHGNSQNGGAHGFFAQFMTKRKETAPPIDQDLADAVTNILENGMVKEEVETTTSQCCPPQNCPRLDLVRVNSEIFSSAKKEVRSDDVMLQRVQRPLMTGLNKLVYLMNSLVVSEGDDIPADALKHGLSEAIALVADASHKLDNRRRTLFKSSINPEFKQLCHDDAPITTQLFGEELSKQIADIKETNKIMSNVQAKNNSSGATRGAFRGKKRRFPFLGPHQNPAKQLSASSHHKLPSHRGKPAHKPRGRGSMHYRPHTHY